MDRQHPNIVQPLGPAAGNHRQVHAAGEFHGRVDIHALQHPVAANIGEQQAGNACIFEPAGKIDHRHIGHIRPALRGDHAILRIDCDHDPAGEFARHILHEIGVFQRGGAHHHPRYAQIEPPLHRLARADAAAELDMAGESLEDRLHRAAVLRLPGETAVQIDHVQMFRPRRREQQRLRGGIVAVHRGARHIAFGQAHDLAGFEINGGEYDHGFHSRKRSSNFSP